MPNFSVRLGSKHTARTALAPTEGYSSSSGFSSLPPSQVMMVMMTNDHGGDDADVEKSEQYHAPPSQLSPLPSSPSSSSASPAESSSSQPDSDSACRWFKKIQIQSQPNTNTNTKVNQIATPLGGGFKKSTCTCLLSKAFITCYV